MKKNIIIVAFVLLITILVGFSNEYKSGFVRKASLYDSVKKKDTISTFDSTLNN
jgi:rare lipoprotein A